MSNLLKTFSLCLVAFSSTGCLDITEELWLQKDRSGRYELTVKVGRSALGALLGVGYQKTNDSLLALGQPPLFADTLLRLSDLPEALKNRLPHRDALDRTTIGLSLERGLVYRFVYDFENLDHLPRFWENLQVMNALQKQDSTIREDGFLKIPMLADVQRVFGGIPQMQLDGRKFTRQIRIDLADSPALGGRFDEKNGDAAFKTMLKNRTYRLALHFPQKIKKVRGKGFKTDGNHATATFPLLEVLRDRNVLACEIDLKK